MTAKAGVPRRAADAIAPDEFSGASTSSATINRGALTAVAGGGDDVPADGRFCSCADAVLANGVAIRQAITAHVVAIRWIGMLSLLIAAAGAMSPRTHESAAPLLVDRKGRRVREAPRRRKRSNTATFFPGRRR